MNASSRNRNQVVIVHAVLARLVWDHPEHMALHASCGEGVFIPSGLLRASRENRLAVKSMKVNRMSRLTGVGEKDEDRITYVAVYLGCWVILQVRETLAIDGEVVRLVVRPVNGSTGSQLKVVILSMVLVSVTMTVSIGLMISLMG